MENIRKYELSTTKAIKTASIIPFIIICTVSFIIVYSVGEKTKPSNVIRSFISRLNQSLSRNEQEIIDSFPYELNSTHVWSMRLADENHFRLARLLSCRTLEYKSGPKIDTIDSCDQSSRKEFSVQNTLQAQKWIYEHQHPMNCTNKNLAIISEYALTGFGATMHQVLWAFARALSQNRIAVYETPGNWLFGGCTANTPDCYFLPITNCSIPSKIDNNQTIRMSANVWYWNRPIHPAIFKNRTMNWYRTQLLLYLMRYKPETLAHVQSTIAQYFKSPSFDHHHPYVAVYVRRSDKVSSGEMTRVYKIKEYFDLFDDDARRANIRTVYVNSEDKTVFDEFVQMNKEKQGYYNLLTVNATRNVVMRTFVNISREKRGKLILEFLTDLFIEVHADLHSGTLSSNWCRIVDGIRLALGKTITYYTPENRFLMDWEDEEEDRFQIEPAN